MFWVICLMYVLYCITVCTTCTAHGIHVIFTYEQIPSVGHGSRSVAYSILPSTKTSIHEDALEIKAYSGVHHDGAVLFPAEGSSSR